MGAGNKENKQQNRPMDSQRRHKGVKAEKIQLTICGNYLLPSLRGSI